MNIGNGLRSIRKQNNMTQMELAKKLNVTQCTISQWETDTTKPSFELLFKLTAILSCTVDELLGGEKTTHREDE